MRIGAFEVNEPVPSLKETHAFAMLRPWVDVGSVGSLTLSRLEKELSAKELGRIAKPGAFFDFTRYRPLTYFQEGHRQLGIPNSVLHYATMGEPNDFLFLHLLEPHVLGEDYVDSIMEILRTFHVRRYCLLGSMYDMVPHTRPLLVTGGGFGKGVQEVMGKLGIQASNYEGPTTILSLISQQALDFGIETMSLIVHLPQYTELEEDFGGEVALIEMLARIYTGFSVDKGEAYKAEQQKSQLDALMKDNPQLKGIISQLEAHYDARVEKNKEDVPELSPEVEKFLKEMDRRFGQS